MSSSSAPAPERVGVPTGAPAVGEERTGVGGAATIETSAAGASASSIGGALVVAAARSIARFLDGKKKSAERVGSREARTASATATP